MTNEKMTNVFCIIPAYNEEKNILNVVEKVLPLADRVIVVDDGSEDETAEILKNINNDKLIVLKHFINCGQGAALQTGNECALSKGAEIIVHFDADGQFLAAEIKDLVQPILAKKADIVFGSRFLVKTSNIPWTKKNIIIPIARAVNRLAIGKNNLSDPQSGFRAMSADTARKIEISQNRMAHCSEILAKAFELNLKIKEASITVIYNEFGQKFSGGIQIVKDLFLGRLLK